MSALGDILYRNETLAKSEAARGCHHAFYLFCILSKLLRGAGVEIKKHDMDIVSTGASWGTIADPATGLEYEIRVTPIEQKKVLPT